MPEKIETAKITATITEGTLFLIAEILRADRGATTLDIDDAEEALKNAIRALSPKRNN